MLGERKFRNWEHEKNANGFGANWKNHGVQAGVCFKALIFGAD